MAIPITPAGDLLNKPNAVIDLGLGPDGLPVALSVIRERDPGQYLRNLASTLDEPPDGPWSPGLDDVAGRIRALLRTHELRQRIWSDGEDPDHLTKHYVSRLEITNVVGQSLLERLLGRRGPLDLAPAPSPSYGTKRGKDGDTREILFANDAVDPSGASLRFHGRRTTCVAIPLAGGHPRLARFTGAEIPTLDRPVISETLCALSDVRYEITRGARSFSGDLNDPSSYLRHLDKACGDVLPGDLRVEASVPRNQVARQLGVLARTVTRFHEKGMVHGDLKPSNVLIESFMAHAIDSLDVPSGGVAPACTVGWAPPEQVLGRPVTPASDVFSIGLMVCTLLRGVIYGRVAEYRVATGEESPRQVTLYERPEVYLDRAEPIVPKNGLLAWQNLIRDCLAFDPGDRPEDATAFADRLETLRSEHPLGGELSLDLNKPGRLRLLQLPGLGPFYGHVVEERG